MQTLSIGATTIWRIRRRYLEHGLTDAIHRRLQPERPQMRRVTGEAEAHLIALACQQAPEGFERWSIRLLTKTALELEIVEQVGRETVRQVQKKRAQTLAQKTVAHSTRTQRGVCVSHGRCVRNLPATLQSQAAADLLR